MRRKKVFYLISHGHTARGAFQTGVVSKLVNSGIDVIVVAENDSDKQLELQAIEQGASLDFYNAPRSFVLGQLNVFRWYVHQNIRKNPSLWEKHQRKTLDISFFSKQKVLYSLYLFLGDVFRVLHPLKRLYLWLESVLYNDKFAKNFILKHRPDAVISTRPIGDNESYLLRAAKLLGVKRIMYILSWDNITAKGIFRETADYYLTWGAIMNDELKEYYGVSEKRMYLTGVTHFDVHANTKSENRKASNILESMGLSAEDPYLFFTMSASYYAPNEIDIIEWLADKIECNYFGSTMQLIVRPHMANLMADRSDLSWLQRLKVIESERVIVDFPQTENSLMTWYMEKDDMVRLSVLLNGASVCLNSGSTIAIESIYLNRPTVITLFDTEQHPEWKSVRRLEKYIHLSKLFNTGGVILAKSLEDLERKIRIYLENPELHKDLRQSAVNQECFKNDGKATVRFVEHINQIIT